MSSTKSDRDRIMELAIGRLFRIASRPSQPGDVEQYENLRRVIMDTADDHGTQYEVSWARDRMKGAQGD